MASPTLAPPSPSASFYDLSDDEEGEYNTIRHTSTGKGVKLLYTKSKVGCPMHRHCTHHLTGAGLRPSHALVQRQHPRIHSPHTATLQPGCRRCASCFVVVRPKHQRLVAAPLLDSRVEPRRCIRYIRQGRSLRLVVAAQTVVPCSAASHTVHTLGSPRICVCAARQRDIFHPHTATEHRMVVWKHRRQHAGWRQLSRALLP